VFAKAMWRRLWMGAALGSVVIGGCSHDQIAAPPVGELGGVGLEAALSAPDTLKLLRLSTYDGSGQSVHPDFVEPPGSWGRGLVYLVLTPYPGGTTKFENPSLYASRDGVTWGAAPGAPMPLAKPQEGYLSDPDILFDATTQQLVLYYRQASAVDKLLRITSPDGASWSSPILVLKSASSTVLSPAIVQRADGDWRMWTVNGAPGCHGKSTSVNMRRSTDGLAWSDPVSVDLPAPAGQFPWHVDMQWISARNEYWALFPVKMPGTCDTRAVYLATSPDGLTWNTLPAPVLTAGAIPEFRDVVYRSTFAYDAVTDEITFWFSGARRDGKHIRWRTAVQRRLRSDVFNADAGVAIPAPGDDVRASFAPP
jgi:hypothetical protein